MLKEFLHYVVNELSPITHTDLDGRIHTSRQMHPIPNPMPKALQFNTLQGLIRFANNSTLVQSELMLHIVDEKEVVLASLETDQWEQRAYLAKATPGLLPEPFPFGRYLNPEEFCIQLRTKFVPSDELDTLIAVAGNISYSATVEVQDDGLSQTVGQKAGVVLKSRAELPTVISLQPFRTFHEIPQPPSTFLVRARKVHDIPELALFVTDGGDWRMDAVRRLANFCEMHLNEHIQVFW